MSKIINIPNSLTIFRILLILPLCYFAKQDNNLLIGIIFLFAAASDYLDGYLARRLNQKTVFGSFLDPIADKMLLTTSLVLLYSLQRVDVYLVILFIALEFLIAGLREFMARHGEINQVMPNWISDRKIDFQFLGLALLFFNIVQLGSLVLYLGLLFTFMSFFFKLDCAKKFIYS